MGDSRNKNKKSAFRRHHADDFSRNASGAYEYSGEYRIFAGGEEAFRDALIKLVTLAAAALVLEVISGLPPYFTTRQQFHVLVPYAVGIGLTVMLLWKTLRLKGTKGKLRAYIYDETVKLLPGLSIVSAILFAVRCAGVVIDLLGRAVSSQPASLTIILISGAAGAACLFLFHAAVKTLRFE